MYCTIQTQRSNTLTFCILATLLTPFHSFGMHQIVKHTTKKAAQRLSMQTIKRTQHPRITSWARAHIMQNTVSNATRSISTRTHPAPEESNLLILCCSASLISLMIYAEQINEENIAQFLKTKISAFLKQSSVFTERNIPFDQTQQSHYLCSTEEGYLCLHPALDDIYRMRFGKETSSS